MDKYQPPHVLIVDDDEDLARELSEGLVLAGLPNHVCRSAAEALSALKAHPDARYIVTDINMPDIDGLELIAKVNLFRDRMPVTTFVMAGAASTEVAIAALRLGVSEFFRKPLDAIEIAEAVRRRELERLGRLTRTSELSKREICSRLMTARKELRRSIGVEIFSEGVWDMLIELMRAEEEGEKMPTTSLVHGVELAMTTALRRIEMLEEAGIIERYTDTVDRRRILIRLTRMGYTRVTEVLDRLAQRLALIEAE